MTVASYGGRKFSSIREAQVVVWPRSQSMSFTATGRPASRPTGLPLRALRVDLGRLLERPLGIDAQKRADAVIDRRDAIEIRLASARPTKPRPTSRLRKCSLAVCSKRDMAGHRGCVNLQSPVVHALTLQSHATQRHRNEPLVHNPPTWTRTAPTGSLIRPARPAPDSRARRDAGRWPALRRAAGFRRRRRRGRRS